jgi:hypothetical protein
VKKNPKFLFTHNRDNPIMASITKIKRQITAVYEGVCRAFECGDLAGAAGFFSDSSEMVKISNGKLLKGKAEMLAYWQERVAAMQGVSVSIAHLEIHPINENTLWATADETISSKDEKMAAVVSNLFVLEEGVWKILLDHTTYLGH